MFFFIQFGPLSFLGNNERKKIHRRIIFFGKGLLCKIAAIQVHPNLLDRIYNRSRPLPSRPFHFALGSCDFLLNWITPPLPILHLGLQVGEAILFAIFGDFTGEKLSKDACYIQIPCVVKRYIARKEIMQFSSKDKEKVL
ncbi:hypothetical protein CDAR_302711 [Caerostris darwini]|uniref:Uncharacterized protein n=1 Tax=Caerostris darwini TaxID=1538125 RepID=A0AAV4V3F0_9ARAC|nr:hypothetical protein CDAR_302711 [Caerostris darwini]